MTSSLKQFKARALVHPLVKKAYDALAVEFAFIDQVLKARAASGVTQSSILRQRTPKNRKINALRDRN